MVRPTAVTGMPSISSYVVWNSALLIPRSAEVAAKCLAVAVFATGGHALIYAAVVRATAQSVAPMTYVQLLVAAGLGWAWFGDAPDAATFAGAALIIGGGLLLWRGQQAAAPGAGR